VFVGILQLIAHVSVPALSLANYFAKHVPVPATKHALYNPNHLFFFVHISDVHIRDTHPDDNLFQEFCNTTLPSISPAFLIITGDLTHSSYEKNYTPPTSFKTDIIDRVINLHRNYQSLSEWKRYYQGATLANEQILKSQHPIHEKNSFSTNVRVFDLGGNHDRMGVDRFDERNYFAKYTMFGKNLLGTRAAEFEYKTSWGEKYQFIGCDFSPFPGPFAPFNFFGVTDENQIKKLDRLLEKNSNSFLFSHYPIPVVSSKSSVHNLESLSKKHKFFAHLSGHLHTMHGMVPYMVAKHTSGHMEMEIPDFIKHHRYRIYAVDNGMVSTVDGVQGDNKPKILITNPKDCRCTSDRESEYAGQMMKESEHVQVLYFSKHAVVSVDMFVNGEKVTLPQSVVTPVKNNLYRLPWNTQDLPSSFDLTVTFTDSSGVSVSSTKKVQLDGQSCPDNSFDGIRAKLVLTSNQFLLFRLVFVFVQGIVCTLILLCGRMWIPTYIKYEFPFYKLLQGVTNLLERRLWVHMTLLVFGFLMPNIPWLAGELTHTRYGLVYPSVVRILDHSVNDSMIDVLHRYYYIGNVRSYEINTGDPLFILVLPCLAFSYLPFLLYLAYTHSTAQVPILERKYGRQRIATILGVLIILLNVFFMHFYWRRIVRTYGKYAMIFGVYGIWLPIFAIAVIGRTLVKKKQD
jgi:Icc-related predicted phosphoesterase